MKQDNGLKKQKPKKVKRERIKLWGNVLDAAMKEIGMSDIELADLANTSASHICIIKQNKTSSISLPVAITIARILKKPVEELWILDPPTPVKKVKKA